MEAVWTKRVSVIFLLGATKRYQKSFRENSHIPGPLVPTIIWKTPFSPDIRQSFGVRHATWATTSCWRRFRGAILGLQVGWLERVKVQVTSQQVSWKSCKWLHSGSVDAYILPWLDWLFGIWSSKRFFQLTKRTALINPCDQSTFGYYNIVIFSRWESSTQLHQHDFPHG